MNRDWILFHLREAHEELTRLLEDIGATPDYDIGEFMVAMQHLYHHLNTAWNARDASPDEVGHLNDADFRRWSRFPRDLPMFE